MRRRRVDRRFWPGAVAAVWLTAPSLTAHAELITLRVGSGHPAGAIVYATGMRDYLVPELERRVAEETTHELRVIEGYAGSIASVAETLEAVQVGMLDIGGYCTCFEPAKLFLHNFAYFVPFGPQDGQTGVRLARQVYDAHPWLEQQLRDNYGQFVLGLNGFDNYHLGTTIPWNSVADLAGVKIAGAGPNLPWLAYAGVIPVQSALPDGYMAMSTGVYNGWLMYPSSYFAFKYHEPAPYYTLIGFGATGGAAIVTMNARSFGRLPQDVQQIVLEVGRAYETEAARMLDERQAFGLDSLRAAGATVRTLPEDVRREWARSLIDFPNDMAQEANERGMPGSQVINTYIDLVTRSGYEWPVEYTVD
jgi:TRAP-type C4-dicarboxylate transport system substrate-binding protein